MHKEDLKMKNNPHDLFNQAMLERTPALRVKLLKELVKENPNYADASLELSKLEARYEYDVLRDVEALLIETQSHLEGNGIDFYKDAGSFYDNTETRPYLRILFTKFSSLLEVGYTLEAMTVADRIIELNEGDNMRVCHQLVNILSDLIPPADLSEVIQNRWVNEKAIEFDMALMHSSFKFNRMNHVKTIMGMFIVEYPEFELGFEEFIKGSDYQDVYETESTEHLMNAFINLNKVADGEFISSIKQIFDSVPRSN